MPLSATASGVLLALQSSYPGVIFDSPPSPSVSNLSPTPAAAFPAECLRLPLLSTSTPFIPGRFDLSLPGVLCPPLAQLCGISHPLPVQPRYTKPPDGSLKF